MKYSLESYRLIIEQALTNNYTFEPFSLDEELTPGRICLRHDVDYSLELALKLAKTNADMKVSGTFFVLLRSHAYNLLTTSSQRTVRQIYELGQNIALHAVIIEGSAPDELERRLRSDYDFALSNLPFLSPVFSWHNSTPEVLARTSSLDKVAGLINAYSARFTHNIAYYSDSNMRHSADDFLRLVSQRQETALQLLFHPLIWVIGGETMAHALAETWQYIIREQEREMRENRIYQELLPEGMPTSIPTNFTEQMIGAMKTKG